MKKKFLVLPLLLGMVSLSGCNTNNSNNKENSNNNTGDAKKVETLDPGTPSWWVDLFTFNNVTMKITRITPFAEVSFAKYIGGKYYIQSSDTGAFVLSPESDYDIGTDFRCHYQTFKMQETDTTCTVTGWKRYSDNDWLYDETITVVDGKLSQIEETGRLASSEISDLIEFYD